jgi:phosphate transport system substrate-binding protein
MLQAQGLSRNSAILLKIFGTVLLCLVLHGCGEKQTTQNQNKVTIRGSNTVGEELAPRLISEYQKEHADVTFDTEFKGTTYGFGALMAGNGDIAAASREVTANEVTLGKDNGVELEDHVIGTYCVAVIVNGKNQVGHLTTNQVRDIFTGTIQNWKDVGGPDAPIHLYIRNPISGTYLGFQEVAMEKKPYAMEVKAKTSHKEIAEAVAKDANGIGYSSMDHTKDTGVKTVAIGGMLPMPDVVNKGGYPYARVLRLYTAKSKATPAASDFIKFVESEKGQKILAEMGFVPHP